MLRLGIDLGTTFSCVACLDANGEPHVIPDAQGALTTPSIVWTDGRSAYVGRPADQRKSVSPHFVFEYVKRNIGRGIEEVVGPDGQSESGVPYEVGGYKYGADGMSAIILRKLKVDALRYAKHEKLIPAETIEADFEPEVIITVPAYFGEIQREATRCAGFAAGLHVRDVINEPTAAACAYSKLDGSQARILVFDLGGGTFDVTLLMVDRGSVDVVTSTGDSALGGKDWDEVILDYLWAMYRARFGSGADDDHEFSFYLRQKAIDAKIYLSEAESVLVDVTGPIGELSIVLQRSRADSFELEDDGFYFEERSSALLHRCMQLCGDVLRRSPLESRGGVMRSMTWADIDDIVLVGGSCRMPMVSEHLERISRRKVRRAVRGLNLDTAVAVGAAIRVHDPRLVRDVLTHSLGIRVIDARGRERVELIVAKDSSLPAQRVREIRSPAAAVLDVYEGESTLLDECTHRGRLELENTEGMVRVSFALTGGGSLRVKAGKMTADGKSLENERDIVLRHGARATSRRSEELRARVMNLTLRI